MGCHPNALARMLRNRREHPDSWDYWTDRIIEATTRATGWDADLWGLDPDSFMVAERAEMARRGGHIPNR